MDQTLVLPIPIETVSSILFEHHMRVDISSTQTMSGSSLLLCIDDPQVKTIHKDDVPEMVCDFPRLVLHRYLLFGICAP